MPSENTQLFASKVETLGSEHFPDSFAGAVLTPSGITEVYVLPKLSGSLIRAIDAINPSGYRVKILSAKRSYNQLNALSARLVAANSGLQARGVTVTRAAPDPRTGAVQVTVEAPTRMATAALSAVPGVRESVGANITASNYVTGATALLAGELGAGFTVEPQYSSPASQPAPRAMQAAQTLDRFHDTPPFFGGDSIIGTEVPIPCTGGFFMVGPTAREYLLTAGHCATNDFDVSGNGVGIGATSTNYFVPGTTNDFQTILVPDGGLPFVWANGTTLHPVTGALLPAVGVQMTFDGAQTGEVPFSTVTAVNATDMNVFDSNSGRTYNIFPVVQAAPPPGTVTCQQGDSGGPAYQREPPGVNVNADAIGTIAAFFGAPGITILCSAQQIGSEEKASGLTLYTVSG